MEEPVRDIIARHVRYLRISGEMSLVGYMSPAEQAAYVFGYVAGLCSGLKADVRTYEQTRNILLHLNRRANA